LSGGKSISLNLGTGGGHSVKEVIDVARSVTGREIRVKMGRRRDGDPPVLVADPRLALQILGWSAKFGMHEMVSSAWRWMEMSMGGARET
jgi:UDP-glucose 4-epimerase